MKEVMKDSSGAKVVAVILGFGLAAIFKRACKGDKCIVVKSPEQEAIERYYYKIEDDCYKYTPYAVNCVKGEYVLIRHQNVPGIVKVATPESAKRCKGTVMYRYLYYFLGRTSIILWLILSGVTGTSIMFCPFHTTTQ